MFLKGFMGMAQNSCVLIQFCLSAMEVEADIYSSSSLPPLNSPLCSLCFCALFSSLMIGFSVYISAYTWSVMAAFEWWP